MVKLHNEVDKFGMTKFVLEREQRIDIEKRKMEFKNSGKIGYVGGPKGPRTGQGKICEDGKDVGF